MAIMIPSVISPEVKSPAERKIFEWFQSVPGTDDWIVLHSMGITTHNKVIYGEIDFRELLQLRYTPKLLHLQRQSAGPGSSAMRFMDVIGTKSFSSHRLVWMLVTPFSPRKSATKMAGAMSEFLLLVPLLMQRQPFACLQPCCMALRRWMWKKRKTEMLIGRI